MLIKTAMNHGNAITLGPVVRDGVTAQFTAQFLVLKTLSVKQSCLAMQLMKDYVFC